MSRWGKSIHHVGLLWRLREIVQKVNRINVDCCNPSTSFVAEKTEGWGNWETIYLREESLTPISPSLTSNFYSVSSVAKSCPTLCDPTDCSTLGFPVLHYLLEFAQIHVYWVSDGIELPYSLPPPSRFVVSLSQHQGLFQWVGSLHYMTKLLELQHQSPMNIQSWFSLGLTSVISLQSMALSRVFHMRSLYCKYL